MLERSGGLSPLAAVSTEAVTFLEETALRFEVDAQLATNGSVWLSGLLGAFGGQYIPETFLYDDDALIAFMSARLGAEIGEKLQDYLESQGITPFAQSCAPK